MLIMKGKIDFKVKQKKQIHPNDWVPACGATTAAATRAAQSSSCCLSHHSPFPQQRHKESRKSREGRQGSF